MSNKCDICSILENKDVFKLVYEDDLCFAILHESPAALGHTLVIPKEHAPIIEEMGDDLVGHIFNVANKISTAIFESLGAFGTNIIVNNGIDAGQELPHMIINIIPRKENDNLNFEWSPKTASQEDLKFVLERLKPVSDLIFSGRDELPKVKVFDENNVHEGHDRHNSHNSLEHGSENGHGESHNKEDSKNKTDYLDYSLRRLP